MRYKKSYTNKTLDAYIAEVEAVRDRILKDFTDMDFENASARNEAEDCVQRMAAECDRLLYDIRTKKV